MIKHPQKLVRHLVDRIRDRVPSPDPISAVDRARDQRALFSEMMDDARREAKRFGDL